MPSKSSKFDGTVLSYSVVKLLRYGHLCLPVATVEFSKTKAFLSPKICFVIVLKYLIYNTLSFAVLAITRSVVYGFIYSSFNA